ncbi:DegT/DnrJ/EryC1/StrS family aminotransferase [Paracraurococcus ruber]|uniref:Erythromycin biosynthesis sensory transduction protein eryC1 n=1 Tax=Paracraurococcus ruber TaxID=77675 RepID=A0ABS1D899_9PROT|nr:DegT/DnrJ/EryC1/StrS family aminotransferase [Paracraurococcus ruber]MBK1662282.1 erythromycin biosynthesis sensory transduction protein eryC1 [Paracraurococcus ruber]TDG16203.1 DegT/DnrJ/EryC1/StrS family aminotransferase [Paracraurococcus ruber]
MNAPQTMIPQANPGAGYLAQKAEIDAAVQRALGSGWYILGKEGEAFEREFAAWLGTARAVGCANGTDALALILRGMGIGEGCTVATVSHTAVATVAAIEMAGATPLLLDIDPDSYTMDAEELASVLEDPPPGLPPVRAAIAVHLYGQACELDPMLEACAAAEVALIEDCAQCHGATLHGRKLGTFGAAAAFSLYPTKNLGALGDGGVLATDDEALAERIAAIRQYGWRERYVSSLVGVNSRLDEVQAAILRVKLTALDAGNARRRAIAAAYDAALQGGPLAPPERRADAEHVFHQYVLRSRHRSDLMARLRAEGVGTGIHYPVPVHLQSAYRDRVALGPAGCAETARAAEEVFSLPMYPELTDAQVEHVCAALRRLGE